MHTRIELDQNLKLNFFFQLEDRQFYRIKPVDFQHQLYLGSIIIPYSDHWTSRTPITLRSFQRPVTRFRARDDRHALCSPVLTCRPACLCPQPVRLAPWRPTKSHPADLILKQIINSDARHIGWSCGLAAVPHRHGTWLLDRKTLLFVPGNRAEGMAKRSHATALTLRPSAGVDARPRRENLFLSILKI